MATHKCSIYLYIYIYIYNLHLAGQIIETSKNRTDEQIKRREKGMKFYQEKLNGRTKLMARYKVWVSPRFVAHAENIMFSVNENVGFSFCWHEKIKVFCTIAICMIKFILVGFVEERPWWPIQSPKNGRKKKAKS